MTTKKLSETAAPAPRVRLLKFGSPSCPPCVAMEKQKTLERLKDEFPELTIVKLDIYDIEGETPPGSEYERNNKISDEYDVEAMPTLVFERDTADGPVEFMRFEGGMAFSALRKEYVKEKEKFEALSSQLSAAKSIPWGEEE